MNSIMRSAKMSGRGAALAASIFLAVLATAACSTTAAAPAPAAALATPVPPTGLATLPPAKPARPAASSADGPQVTIENFNFLPADLTVPAGATVSWTNHDDVQHTVTSANKAFGSPSVDTDGQFSFAFSAAGTYDYFCAIHPFMTAKVIVQ